MNAQDHVIMTYLIECEGDPLAFASKIASDQSTGTFVDLPGETPELKARVAARVLEVREIPPNARASIPQTAGSGPYRRVEADIAFPMEAIGDDLAALMTITVGGVFSIRGFTGIRVLRMQLPDGFGATYPGPQFGINGTRQLTGVENRPIIGTIIKPALGLRPHETAEMVKELIASGVDFIKDDEKLCGPPYSSLEDRVAAIMPLIKDHEQRTGKKVMYAFNISHVDPDVMMRNHDMVAAAGGNAAVININSIGQGSFLFLRKRSRLALHAHRNGWDILTRHPGLGMNFSVYQQYWRLLGVDQFQINGIGSKYWEPDDSFIQSFHDLAVPFQAERQSPMPVVCSGQWGGQAPETYRRTGRTLDLLYLCGGGVVSHPGGPGAGVKAVRQAWEAAQEGIELDVYARSHPELKQALEKFGRPS
ncbi:MULTISPECIES: 3-oxo-isoapionate-4-phosphate decarboxylase OiaX [Ensifer]|jgi:ribulose 1,5-bisphosphate carboxylase large subunit-like protein|uniref:3-oxo-isoapionate-4-phosphate decarboxylase OiaX n=1 Tax=Ensifer TaxID=106591 RepID=UPI000713EC71|nr:MULTISPECIES: 3-oxo-isoapionate-4-phosphate decarboxylase OiaX [Ensifer]KQX51352.1 ribulose 1,5-bisphosphate carboxylase [Ensifer sp. Root1298]KQX83717.1 ribulose 1,5-bisphosphate carboxylase [Ensifer sp. Root1312]KRC20062.1 ribulose 1,5-bisphosphate carboxylase [Ensifer sp. Root74]KRD63309.1 ribulose 1,5-bisphosphate carboxylase [Ensifer sp. Root954]